MVDKPETQSKIAKNIIEMSLSVRETEKMVKRVANGGEGTVENKQVKLPLDPNLKNAEVKLRRHFGTQIKIVPDGRGTGGRIELEYYSEADLDRIFQLMLQSK
jgi:ParB family chromosome partitioning protein